MAAEPPFVTRAVIENYKSIAHCDVPLGPLTFLIGRNGAGKSNFLFTAASMSDGTLHALGILVALFQGGFLAERRPAVIGIEEPEAALHPAATAVLRDAFAATAELSQVIVTTQSADLLDDEAIAPEAILAVDLVDGATRIGPLGAGQQSILRDHLATAGELLRTSNFRPALADRSGRAVSEAALPAIGCIVEGEGDELALPVLIRRIAAELDPPVYADIFIGKRAPRSSLVQDRGIEAAVEQMARVR